MSISQLAVLLSAIFVFSWSANARKDSGDYWKGVMKDEPMPISLEALILPNNVVNPTKSNTLKKPSDCSEEHHAKKLATVPDNDFEPRPSLTAYVNEMVRDNNFEPRPSVTAYVKVGESSSFEPRPNVSAYGG